MDAGKGGRGRRGKLKNEEWKRRDRGWYCWGDPVPVKPERDPIKLQESPGKPNNTPSNSVKSESKAVKTRIESIKNQILGRNGWLGPNNHGWAGNWGSELAMNSGVCVNADSSWTCAARTGSGVHNSNSTPLLSFRPLGGYSSPIAGCGSVRSLRIRQFRGFHQWPPLRLLCELMTRRT